jgi:flagellar hook-associated protein 2
MGRIQTNVGLISGLPIADTVDKLMSFEARPRDMLVGRNDGLKKQQSAITELAALLVSVQYVAKNLGKPDLYAQRGVTSSNPDVLAATVSGSPTPGGYSAVPLRAVQSHQLLSSGLQSDTSPMGSGSVSFRFGDDVERSAGLSLFGAGNGLARGKIRISDRSGASAEVNLSTAQTIDDVLAAINGASGINVAAVVAGDSLRLIDRTGQAVSNLKVQEVGAGGTAASLGLAGIDVAASSVDGQDMLRLYDTMQLSVLNDGRGIRTNTVMPDIEYKLRDGTTGTIDLSPILPGGSQVDKETTLAQVVQRINAAAPAKLKVEIAPDGKRLVATDLTQGGDPFELNPLFDSASLADLGLNGPSVDGVITGGRILSGSKSVLLSSLAGGKGLGRLGTLSLTDRSGASATVDLSGAETLAQVIDSINAAGIGIVAQTNRARTGMELVDTTGQSSSPMIVASADGQQTAEKLNLAVNDAVTVKSSGDLHLQVVAQNTRLADLNGGAGVALSTLTIQDSTGKRAVLNLNQTGIETVGDVIQAIHRLDLNVRAEINDTGDGIRLVDTGGGTLALAVSEGASTAAKDLHLLGGTKTIDIGGQPTQVVDGSTTYTVELDGTDSLADLRQRINDLGAGVTAAVLNDGTGTPYRLVLSSDRAGRLGRIVFDGSGLGLDLQETSPAQDALLLYGSSDPATGILVASSSNTFRDVIPGVTLDVKQPTLNKVTVAVNTVDTNLVASVKTLVDNYNKFRKRLGELTKVDAAAGTGSMLTGDVAALRMDVDLSRVLSGRFNAGGPLQSLAAIGVTVNSDGTLALDESRLRTAYASDPAQVKQFLSKEDVGVSARLAAAIEQMAGDKTSLVTERLKAIDHKISANQDRIDSMNKHLDNQRQRLLTQFYNLETAIAKMKDSLNMLSAIQFLPSLVSQSQTSSSV